MFKDCFGFEGRIRRLEYGLTYIIVVVGINLIFVFGGFLGKFSNLFYHHIYSSGSFQSGSSNQEMP
jgi:uncharacterized membrane protein YhaH (DUF805 family)